MEAHKRGFKGMWLCAAIYESQELSPVEKLLLAEIDALTTDANPCYASNAHFSHRLGITTTRVDHLLGKLPASQAKTVDQVLVSVPVRAFSQANEAQFYVSMSRARSAMHVFTDSKVALRDAVTRPSKRLSSWELVDEVNKDSALKAELDSKGRKHRNNNKR